ncbi:MAG: hypothetical protein L0Y60_04280 [Beijerinckiaceae bacterium]|nr:hypothetical protein [Beijerinckiaceae bacterium]
MKDLIKTADALLRDLYGHHADILYRQFKAAKPPPKPRYQKGDTTAARARLAELRAKEALGLRVPVPIGEPSPSRPAVSGRKDPSDEGELVAELPVVQLGQEVRYPASVSSTAIAVANVSGCRFPLGDPGAANFSFCNAKATHGAYCECHRNKMWCR